ncbi:alpha-2-macroglobulin family protein [Pedobacter cryoconitis]|uniref:MG2 domain-containing protein n=1 Tax=Pedobacter cryoconitis TaxID=188932 RepID=A0A327RXA9_9SPHI|nr:alpha-2-macroglobulin family protein [Pedobacter cryoconitis]RAJ20858.1 MG2 domain-containing protein [Pedobacter cryoconitis]
MKIALRLTLCFAILLFFPVRTFSQQLLKASDKDFAKVDSLANQQKPIEALALINNINKQARAHGNTTLLIKSAMYRIMFHGYLEEDGFIKVLTDLKEDVRVARQPEKSVLQSLLAETYWNFYQRNRYKFFQRTTVQNNSNDDVNTWSIQQITKETVKNLLWSLSEKQQLQNTKVGLLNNLLLGDTSTRYLRPTLYDLLAHRALDILMNSEIELTKSGDDGVDFSDPRLSGDYKTFVSLKMKTNDSTSFSAAKINILQSLLQYHAENHNEAALADADLQRLKFIYDKSTAVNKEADYLKAIDLLASQSSGTEIYTDILYQQALFYSKELSDKKKPDLIKAVAIAQKAIKAFPKSNGAKNAESLIKEIRSKTLGLQLKEFSQPGKPSQLFFTYKNINTIQLELYKVPAACNDYYYTFNDKEKYSDFMKSHKPVKVWSEVLPEFNDYQEHTRIGKMDALPTGNYILIVRNTKDINQIGNVTQQSNFRVTSMAVTQRHVNDQKEYFVASSLTGIPLKGVVIQELLSDFKENQNMNEKSPVFKTNAAGYAVLASQETLNVRRAMLVYGTDTLYMPVNSYGNNIEGDRKQVILFTDRAIYRPGQTVYYKGLLMEYKNYKNSIVTGLNLFLTFKDANYKDIETVTVKTNDYGTFQGSFTIPTGKLNGMMQLTTMYGSIGIQVEEYKRPAFEIVFDPSNQQYKLNDSVKVQGKALSFSGYSVTGAKVSYKVFRTRIPNYSYGRSYQRESLTQIAIGTTETKEGGRFEVKFLAAAEPMTNENYTFKVTADITDLNGETRTATKSINAGQKDLVLNADLPKELFLKSEADVLPVGIQNLNGEPITAKLNAEWTALQYPGRLANSNKFSVIAENYTLSKEEFVKAFPTEDYKGDTDPVNWLPFKNSFNQHITVNNGKGELKLTAKNLSPGYYKVKLTAENKDNDTVSITKIVRIYNTEVTTIQSINEWLVAEKTTITPSESAIFRIAGILPDAKAYYEVYYKDSIAEKVWVKISPEQTIVKIKPGQGFEDAFAVQFTMVQNGVVYNALKHINIVDVSKELDINFLTFRNKLQPGEKETWKLKISNKKGEQQMAEMVATLYDASLDELKKMDWQNINAPSYHYTAYEWKFEGNKLNNTSQLGFVRYYSNYYQPHYRNYEQLSITGSNMEIGSSYPYQDYIQKLAIAARKVNTEIAVKKLAALQKGALVYGVITDRQGYAIPGASIVSGKFRITADAYGIYSIKAKSGDQFSVSAIGFVSSKINLNQLRRVDIVLENDGRNLNEIVVSARPMQKKNAMSSTTIMLRGASTVQYNSVAAPQVTMEDSKVYDFISIDTYDAKNDLYIVNGRPVRGTSKVVPRVNFNETAFFYPQLKTNETGEINIEFTIPQSLTRYKMMGFAHTKDLKTATVVKELITQKQLAISVNAPRFFREGDTILLSAKLNNLSGKLLKGEASLELRDALTGKLIQILSPQGKLLQKFDVADKGNEVLKWPLIIPSAISAITYKVVAQSGEYSDGEEMTVPVLPNSMLVTETMPLNVRGNTTKTFTLDKLLQSGTSKTLKNQALTFEFTANPIWYAIQSLPYLMEYPYECAEQTFSRFYANSFATGIINSSPKIKQVFNQWQQTNSGEALLSNLEKNPELKSILLEETPWVGAAASDAEQKKRLAVLFDLNRMSYELKNNFEKLAKMQKPNGSFAWFTGMSDDRYITQHIVLGMGQLQHLKLIDEKTAPGSGQLLNKAIIYLDNQLQDDFKKEVSGKGVAYLPLHYLYGRSYTAQQNNDPGFRKAVAYYLKKVADNWKTMEPYQQAQAALVLNRSGNKTEAVKIINLLKESAQQSDEMGMYWASNRNGWWWYQNPIETQALLIEAFDEIAADTKAVEEMKIWLLKNKQTNDWKTTKATAAACYALLLKGYNLLAESAKPEILIGNQTFGALGIAEAPKEAGTGYQKVSIAGPQVKPEMATIKIKNNNKTMAWGGVYWQYFEQLDKITSSATGVKIKKQLFIQKQTAKGDVLTPLTPSNMLMTGDLLKVRIEIYADRDMEYVHLKDMRAAGFEPVNVISSYKYQDGLGYYESTKDASTNFFISYLRKGVYVFEYALRVTHTGNFSNGITTLQCMYAPEFTTHSPGVRVTVKQ